MITKTITTTDYNGVEYTEEFRFNLTKAELMEWELSIPGGLTGRIKAVTDSKNLLSCSVNLLRSLTVSRVQMVVDSSRAKNFMMLSNRLKHIPRFSWNSLLMQTRPRHL